MDEVEHVIVANGANGGEPENAAPLAGEEAVAAAAAVALAEATAAAAELDAAERMRRFETEHETWRNEHTNRLQSVSDSLTLLRQDELQRHATERAALAESCRQLSERQEAIEAQFRSLIPPPSDKEGSAAAEAAAAEAAAAENPELGTAAEVEAGPVSLDASLAADVERNSPNSEANRVRKRRWI